MIFCLIANRSAGLAVHMELNAWNSSVRNEEEGSDDEVGIFLSSAMTGWIWIQFHFHFARGMYMSLRGTSGQPRLARQYHLPRVCVRHATGCSRCVRVCITSSYTIVDLQHIQSVPRHHGILGWFDTRGCSGRLILPPLSVILLRLLEAG